MSDDTMTATARATELMIAATSQETLPQLAHDYAETLCLTKGRNHDTLMQAYAHYAQIIEGLNCDDPDLIADKPAKQFFKRARDRQTADQPLPI